MNRSSYCSALLLLTLATPAGAQPLPTTPEPGAPTAVPASTATTPPAVPEGAPVTPSTDVPVTPTEPVPPEPPPSPPPPPPPPPKLTGLLPSSATDQSLVRHDLALDSETTLPDHPFTGFVFADYWFANGPRIGATAGMFRAFEAHVGVLVDSLTMPATGGGSTSSSSTRFFYGASVGLLSLYGVQLAGGLTLLTGQGDTSEMVPTGTLSLPLDAHWLPFRLEKTRVRITYPIGIGIEWGTL